MINKVITTSMAFCLSHLKNWMHNLSNSCIMVSWSVTDFYNESCNTSAVIWRLNPLTTSGVLMHLQLNWACISADRACWLLRWVSPGFPSAQRWRLACTVLPCLGWLVQFLVAMEDVLGYLLFWQKRVSVLGTLRHCPVWRVLCKKFYFFCFLIAHHLIRTKERMLQWWKGKGTVAPLFPCRYWLLDVLSCFNIFKGYIFWTVPFCQSKLKTSWAQSCMDGCPSGRAWCRAASGQVPRAVLGNLQLCEEGAPGSEFRVFSCGKACKGEVCTSVIGRH